MNKLYSFVFRGLLCDEALDKAGRHRKKHFGFADAKEIKKSLCYDMLEPDCLTEAQRMSIS